MTPLTLAGDLAESLSAIPDEELRDAEIARCLRVIAEASDSDAHGPLMSLADEIEHQAKQNMLARDLAEREERFFRTRELIHG